MMHVAVVELSLMYGIDLRSAHESWSSTTLYNQSYIKRIRSKIKIVQESIHLWIGTFEFVTIILRVICKKVSQ